jgi:hypothetical protein
VLLGSEVFAVEIPVFRNSPFTMVIRYLCYQVEEYAGYIYAKRLLRHMLLDRLETRNWKTTVLIEKCLEIISLQENNKMH